MAKCPNCGSSMSCSCQKRTLPNGATGCTSCLGKVAGATKGPTPAARPVKKAPVTIEGKGPVGLNVWGKERYKDLTKFTK
jgi:hypothetical protein